MIGDLRSIVSIYPQTLGLLGFEAQPNLQAKRPAIWHSRVLENVARETVNFFEFDSSQVGIDRNIITNIALLRSALIRLALVKLLPQISARQSAVSIGVALVKLTPNMEALERAASVKSVFLRLGLSKQAESSGNVGFRIALPNL
jgi:hypothetical protein